MASQQQAPHPFKIIKDNKMYWIDADDENYANKFVGIFFFFKFLMKI